MTKETDKKVTSRDLQAMETKLKIMECSTRLFFDKGYKGATLGDVLKETNLSKGAFYHHFQSKEELYVETIKYLIDEFAAIPYDSFDNSSLYNFYTDYINYVTKQSEDKALNSFSYTTLLYNAIKQIPDLSNHVEKIRDSEEQSWILVVKNARANGEIETPMSDEQITKMFLSSSNGIGMNGASTNESDKKSILIDLWNAFYKGLK